MSYILNKLFFKFPHVKLRSFSKSSSITKLLVYLCLSYNKCKDIMSYYLYSFVNSTKVCITCWHCSMRHKKQDMKSPGKGKRDGKKDKDSATVQIQKRQQLQKKRTVQWMIRRCTARHSDTRANKSLSYSQRTQKQGKKEDEGMEVKRSVPLKAQ